MIKIFLFTVQRAVAQIFFERSLKQAVFRYCRDIRLLPRPNPYSYTKSTFIEIPHKTQLNSYILVMKPILFQLFLSEYSELTAN
jgi:hypothetical protein